MVYKKYLTRILLFGIFILFFILNNQDSMAADTDFTINSSGTITAYNGVGGNVVIPSTINGIIVKGIGVNAFSSKASITSLTIPNSVTSIGRNAFGNCTGLLRVTLPNGLTTLDSIFSGCTGLTDVTIPDSVTVISGTFKNCSGLTNINIPRNVTTIEANSFYGCIKLSEIIIPDSVTKIGSYAFYGCTGIQSTSISDNLIYIGNYAFEGCLGLINISLPESVTLIGASAFQGCSSLTSIIIPNGLTSISDNTFNSCISLRKITISNSVTLIGQYAFQNCTSLIGVNIPSNVTDIDNGAFKDCTSLTGAYFGGNAPDDNVTPGEILGSDIFTNTAPSFTIYYKHGSTGFDSPAWSCYKQAYSDSGNLIHVTGITLSEPNISIYAGNSEQITATISPSSASNKNVIWSTSDSSIADVVSGLITGVKSGTAIIRATSASDNNIYAECTVTVKGSTISPSNATFDKNSSLQADISITMNLGSNVLNKITNGTYTLINGTDYTLSGNTVIVKKEYLAKQPIGITILSFNFSAGENQSLSITIVDTTNTSQTLPAPVISANILGTINKDTGSIIVNWNSVRTDAYYYIEIRNMSGISVWTYPGSITGTSFTITSDYLKTLIYGTDYYIFVTAHAGTLNSLESNHLSFSTATLTSKPIVTVTSPVDGISYKLGSSIQLSATATNCIAMNAKWTLEGSIDSNYQNQFFTTQNNNNFSTTFTPILAGTYDIEFYARNSDNVVNDPKIVKIVITDVLPAPVISANISGPINKETGSITVTWNSVSSNAYYYLGIKKVGLTSPFTSDVIQGTSFTITTDILKTLEYGTNYYIFVTAHVGGLASTDSNHLNFSTTEDSLTVVNLKASDNLEIGQTDQLTATVSSSNATYKDIVWTIVSGNNKILMSSQGYVTAISSGVAIVKATIKDDDTKYAYCVITVKKLNGDINDDGKITNNDLLILKDGILMKNDSINLSSEDLDGDGKVTSRDYAMLLKKSKAFPSININESINNMEFNIGDNVTVTGTGINCDHIALFVDGENIGGATKTGNIYSYNYKLTKAGNHTIQLVGRNAPEGTQGSIVIASYPMDIIVSSNFSDVDKNYYAYKEIQSMVDDGIIDGYPDGTFRPNNQITRAEFAKILSQMPGLQLNTTDDNIFADVNSDFWAYEYIKKVQYICTIYKDDNTGLLYFMPSDYIDREDIAAMIVQIKNIDVSNADISNLNAFSDNTSISPELKPYISIALSNNIIKGTDIGFEPNRYVTRAEACVMLYRAFLSQ